MQIIERAGLFARLRNLFPERELIVRAQGQVRFIRISSRLQQSAAAIAVGLALVWLAAMGALLWSQIGATGARAQLLERDAQVAAAAREVSAYRTGVARTAAELARRQAFLEQAMESELGQLTAEEDADASKAQRTKVSAAVPDDLGLAAIERRQLALAERLTRLADARSSAAETAIRRLGLNPRLMLAKHGRSAQGGPLQGAAHNLGPKFAALGRSLARMEALRGGLAAVPHNLPAGLEYISSGFGYRSDPFTGEAALHSGLDFRGPMGAPIYAAADGRVSFAGVKAGYGNCIEIVHGNGMMTRYAHMSAFKARVGQTVTAGDAIGAIGSTGRSTGPHLHFEVRINDQAVNPRPFLEAGERIRSAA